MLICLAVQCTAAYSLAKYDSLRDNISSSLSAVSPNSTAHANVAASRILTIVFYVLVATLFGADFSFRSSSHRVSLLDGAIELSELCRWEYVLAWEWQLCEGQL